MPILFNDHKRRLAFQFGRQHGLRSTNETIDQLQSQLAEERNQNAFNTAEMQRQIGMLLREIAELRLEIARRDREASFANLPVPSGMMH
jgi:ribosomal protein S4